MIIHFVHATSRVMALVVEATKPQQNHNTSLGEFWHLETVIDLDTVKPF